MTFDDGGSVIHDPHGVKIRLTNNDADLDVAKAKL
jgi:hypothetical protein